MFRSVVAVLCSARRRCATRRRPDPAEGVHGPLQRQGLHRLARVGHPHQGGQPVRRAGHDPGGADEEAAPSGRSRPRSTGRSTTARSSTTARTGGRPWPRTRTTATSSCWSSTRSSRRPTPASTCGPPRRCRCGTRPTPPRRATPGRAAAGCSTTRRSRPARDPLVQADNPPGEWNKFRIIMVGDKATVYLNDKLVVDHATPAELLGPQGGPAAEEGPDPAPDPPAGRDPLAEHLRPRNPRGRGERTPRARRPAPGSSPCSTASRFAGWAGALQNYEVKDGAISASRRRAASCSPRTGSPTSRRNWSTRCRPAATTGWRSATRARARRPTTACASCKSSTTTAAKYAKLDPRQFNGSPYGMAAANRGYGRPAGEWNFMLVTVRGPTIQVELNGTRSLTPT